MISPYLVEQSYDPGTPFNWMDLGNSNYHIIAVLLLVCAFCAVVCIVPIHLIEWCPRIIPYRGTSLVRTPPTVGPYSSPMPRDLW